MLDSIFSSSQCRKYLKNGGWLHRIAELSVPRQEHQEKLNQTYTWPSSWAMVKAALSPLSCTMEHEVELSHIVPSSARPSVSHFSIWGFRQMFSLWDIKRTKPPKLNQYFHFKYKPFFFYLVKRSAVSWWNGLASSGSLKTRCHLQKLRNISDADLPGRLSSISCDSLLLVISSADDVSTNSWSLRSNIRTTAIWTGLPRLASL